MAGGVDFGQWLNEALTFILDTVQSVDPVLRTVLAGFAIMLETSILIGLIVPGDTVVIVASTAVGSLVEAMFLIAAVIVGALIGESIGFALGRFFGPKIRQSRLGDRIGRAHWDQAERYLARRGGVAVFISRFLPVLHSLIPVTVGMSAMRYRTFMAWTVPATTIWSIAYVSVGALAAGSFRELLDGLHYAGYIFVGIVAGFTVLAIVAKKLLQRSQRRHMEHNDTDHE
ncbi:DedA family protein [Salinibacterium sp. TMP30]|uniref:DedA family protein n=1 Tax=Salinibacterium sp. TMP30 TaxID=3138237 RepID=UPI00313A3EC8